LMGMTCNFTNSFILHPFDANKCVYSIGPTLIVSELEDSHNQVLLKRHDSPISCIAVSQCATMIASGQFGSSLMKDAAVVNLWDLAKTQLIHTFTGLMHKVHKLIFSPDSKFLIAVDLNGLFIVWDTVTFETIFAKQLVVDRRILNIDSMDILSQVQDSTNSKHNVYKILVSYGHDLHEWTMRYSVKHMEYILSSDVKYAYPPNRTFNRTLTHLACSPLSAPNQSDLVAATTHVGEVYLFSPKHGVYTNAFQACSKGANVACFLDADNIFVGGGDGALKHFYLSNTTEWVLARSLKLPSAVNTLVLSQDRKVMYATTSESNLYRIDPSTLAATLLLESPFNPISNIAFASKYNHIFATLTSTDGMLKVWDLSNYHSVAEVRKHDNTVSKGTALSYHDGNEILCGFDDGTIACNQIDFQDPAKSGVRWKINNAHRGKVNCLKVLQDTKGNQLLLSGGDDGLLNIWNYNTKQLVFQITLMIEGVITIVVDPKYKEIVHLLGNNGQIATFSLRKEGIIIRRMIRDNKRNFGRINSMVQNKAGEFELIAVTSNGWILIWDHELTEMMEAIDCKPQLRDQNLNILSCALSSSSKYLCCGNSVGELFVMHWEKQQVICREDIHSNGISSMAWTPDDKQIITTSADSSIAVSNFYV